jgi:hypothetical protein
MLVYPRVSKDVDVTYEVSGVRVSSRTVDLDSSDLAGLRSFAEEIGTPFASLTEATTAGL